MGKQQKGYPSLLRTRPAGLVAQSARGFRIVSHSRMTVFQMAEVAVPEALFAALLERICCMVAAPT